MAGGFPFSLNGSTYFELDFVGYAYVQTIPRLARDIAAVGQSVQDATAVIAGYAPGETTLASAATVNIGATTTARVAITGAAVITGLGPVSGRIRFLRFVGAATLTHSAALILPGAANIVTAAGDTAIAVAEAANVWRVFGYQRGDGGSSPAALTKMDVVAVTGNWTKPTWARFIDFVLVAGGGGGGSGRRGAAGTGRGGGGGGGAGGFAYGSFPADELAATLSVEVGLGGNGGAAVTTNDTNGNAGAEGGNTRVLSAGTVLLAVSRGGGGTGGTAGSANGGLAGLAASMDTGNGSGGSGQAGPGGGPQNGLQAVAGAGGGGGLTSGNTPGNGAGGGFSSLIARITNPGLGGTAPGGNGGDGQAKSWSRGYGGAGGGGAGGDAAGTIPGGNGGNGTPPGGPGGGGGGSTNGANSGAGGNGGAGVVYIIARG